VSFHAARTEIYNAYRSRLDSMLGIEFQPSASWADVAPWMFSITIDEHRFGMNRDDLMLALAKRQIETRPFFVPLHLQPPFREQAASRDTQYPIATRLGRTGMNLPTFVGMSEDDVASVVQAIGDIRDRK
jgi:perosamine synthetase